MACRPSDTIARYLLITIEMLVGQLEAAGLPDRTAPLLREARLILDSARESLTVAADYERLCDQAAPWLAHAR